MDVLCQLRCHVRRKGDRRRYQFKYAAWLPTLTELCLHRMPVLRKHCSFVVNLDYNTVDAWIDYADWCSYGKTLRWRIGFHSICDARLHPLTINPTHSQSLLVPQVDFVDSLLLIGFDTNLVTLKAVLEVIARHEVLQQMGLLHGHACAHRSDGCPYRLLAHYGHHRKFLLAQSNVIDSSCIRGAMGGVPICRAGRISRLNQPPSHKRPIQIGTYLWFRLGCTSISKKHPQRQR